MLHIKLNVKHMQSSEAQEQASKQVILFIVIYTEPTKFQKIFLPFTMAGYRLIGWHVALLSFPHETPLQRSQKIGKRTFISKSVLITIFFLIISTKEKDILNQLLKKYFNSFCQFD